MKKQWLVGVSLWLAVGGVAQAQAPPGDSSRGNAQLGFSAAVPAALMMRAKNFEDGVPANQRGGAPLAATLGPPILGDAPPQLPPTQAILPVTYQTTYSNQPPGVLPMHIPPAAPMPMGPATYAPTTLEQGCGEGCQECQAGGCGLWLSAEYLLWWSKNGSAPPLVTASPQGSRGVLGQPGTAVLYGDSLDSPVQSGGRFGAGLWLDRCHTCFVEGNYFFLGARSANFQAGNCATPDQPAISRPFINGLTGLEDSQLVALNGVLCGTVAVSSYSQLQGAELNVGRVWQLGGCCGPRGLLAMEFPSQFELLAGFRWLSLDEGLNINEDLGVDGRVPGAGDSHILVGDHFQTRNNFFGAQGGFRWTAQRGNWFVTATGKVALGSTNETAEVWGSTTIIRAGQTATNPGGLLALPTNSGHFSRNVFAVAPEAGLRVGYRFTPHLSASVGYNFLYLSSVARPGDQIDRTVNPTQLPRFSGPGNLVGPPSPAFLLRDGDFWAQGINFGLELQF